MSLCSLAEQQEEPGVCWLLLYTSSRAVKQVKNAGVAVEDRRLGRWGKWVGMAGVKKSQARV